MFFELSKIGWYLLAPLNFLVLLFAFACVAWLLHRRLGLYFLSLSLLLFFTIAIFPVGHNLMVLLEQRYSKPIAEPVRVDGIIVLGGAISADLSAAHQEINYLDTADRIHQFAALAKSYPEAELVYSGGNGDLFATKTSEANLLTTHFQQFGLSSEQIIFEDKSRNTFENIRYSRRLVKPSADEKWLVITSAFHMPRAMNVFKKMNWQVTPWPVDYRTDGVYKIIPQRFNVLKQFTLMHIAAKEYIGNSVYYFTNRGASLLPGASE